MLAFFVFEVVLRSLAPEYDLTHSPEFDHTHSPEHDHTHSPEHDHTHSTVSTCAHAESLTCEAEPGHYCRDTKHTEAPFTRGL